MKKYFLCIIFISFFNYSQSTELTGKDASAIIKNAETIVLSNDDFLPSFIQFKKGEEIEFSTIQEWIKNQFNLDSSFGMELENTETDNLGYTHYRYKQTYNEYPVLGCEYIIHVKNNKVISLNGRVKKIIDSPIDIKILETIALQKVLNNVNATTYMWQLPQEERMLQNIFDRPEATYYPSGELMIVPEGGNLLSNQYRLAYRFDIFASEPLSRQYIFIDAENGNIITTHERIQIADVQGTAVTKYSGTKTITTDSYNGTYRLKEAGRGNGIQTYNLKNGTSYASGVDFTDTDNNWNNVNAAKDEIATDAHWGTEMTYDYFMTKHNRNSIDNKGFKLISYVHYGNDYNNAFWNGSYMTYGDGNGAPYTPFTAIEICGHEITHGLTSNTAALIYQNESGALNEGFSDIFAMCIDKYARPEKFNWEMGEDIGKILRSMSNPNAYNCPDTYKGDNWYTGTGDNGGVHYNGAVLSYWFYLLCEGGFGTNDIGNTYNVKSIGMDKAAAIAYRTLTNYLTSSSQYNDARTYSIQACKDLYPGDCAPELIAVTNAWYAVGLGSPFAGSLIAFTSDKKSFCSLPASIQFTNQSSGASSYKWYFGDGNSSTSENPIHTYTNEGNYDVKLVLFGGSCGNDSITKSQYIKIDVPNAPTATGASSQTPASVTLTASGTGTINWYDAPTGGTLLNTGNTFTTPVLYNTKTYFVQNDIIPAVQSAGIVSKTTNGAYYTSTSRWALVFDAFVPLTIKTVKVYANTSGNRTIWIKNPSTGYADSITINIPSGEQVVTLNFNIEAGTGYQMGSNGACNLWRESSGATYPYTTSNILTITGNTAGSSSTAYYYYFYDWQIAEPSCSSKRTPVTVVIGNVNITEENSLKDYLIYPNPTNGIITLDLVNTINNLTEIEIMDMLGQTIFKKITSLEKLNIDLSNFSEGIYLLKLTHNETISLNKIIFEK